MSGAAEASGFIDNRDKRGLKMNKLLSVLTLIMVFTGAVVVFALLK